MSWRCLPFLQTVALAAAGLLFVAGPAAAQRGSGGGGGSRGGAGYRAGGGYYGGGGYRGGYTYGRYSGRGGYYPGFYGVGLGYYPYFDGGSYPSVGYYGTPGPADYAYLETPVPYRSFYPPLPEDSGLNTTGTLTASVDDKAHVRVVVPTAAQVWFDGDSTSQAGSLREFVSPPLSSEGTYSYEIRARWMENGTPMEQTRRVTVRAGALTTVDFTRPAPAR